MRRILGAGVAVLLAMCLGACAQPHRSRALDVPLPTACQNITPDNWFLWWLYGCDKDSAGGGGGGAG